MNVPAQTDSDLDASKLEWVARDQMQTRVSHDYLPVDIALLVPGPVREFDLYEQTQDRARLFCAGGYGLTRNALGKLRKQNISTLLVPADQGPGLMRYVEGVLREVMKDKSVSVDRRSRILYTSSSSIMAEIMANPKARSLLRRTISLTTAMSRFLATSYGALGSMGALFGRGQDTHIHAVNSAVLGMAMYKYLVSPRLKEIRRFGLGMLLLDIGKSCVGASILNKPGRLTDEEFQQMKAHPTVGWEILRHHRIKDYLIRDAVLYHHEKLDGSGYPVGLSGGDVPPGGRIAAIIDIYDALTTDRPYRRAMEEAEALDLMINEMVPHQLDAEYVSVFERLIIRQIRQEQRNNR